MAALKRSRDEVSDLEDDHTLSTTTSQELHNPVAKYSQYDVESTSAADSMESYRCKLRAHRPINFVTRGEYEQHLANFHANDCPQPNCGKNFPTPRLQALHHDEHHNPIVSIRRSRGEKVYGCFVEGCDKICKDWARRKLHLRDKHQYPKNYEFKLVETGMFAGCNGFLRPGINSQGHRRSSSEQLKPMDTNTPAITGSHTMFPAGSNGVNEEDSALSMDDETSHASDDLTESEGKSPEDAAVNSPSPAATSPPKLQRRRKCMPSTRLEVLGNTNATVSKDTVSDIATVTSGDSATKPLPTPEESRSNAGSAGESDNAIESKMGDLAVSMSALRFVPLSVQKKRREKAKVKAKPQRDGRMDLS